MSPAALRQEGKHLGQGHRVCETPIDIHSPETHRSERDSQRNPTFSICGTPNRETLAKHKSGCIEEHFCNNHLKALYVKAISRCPDTDRQSRETPSLLVRWKGRCCGCFPPHTQSTKGTKAFKGPKGEQRGEEGGITHLLFPGGSCWGWSGAEYSAPHPAKAWSVTRFSPQALPPHMSIVTNIFISEFMTILISLESLKLVSLTTAGFTLKLQQLESSNESFNWIVN